MNERMSEREVGRSVGRACGRSFLQCIMRSKSPSTVALP